MDCESEAQASYVFLDPDIPVARDFRLSELPRDHTGQILYRGESQAEYEAYVNWLAHHLYKVEIPVESPQQRICGTVREMTKEAAVSWLGVMAAIYEVNPLPIEALE